VAGLAGRGGFLCRTSNTSAAATSSTSSAGHSICARCFRGRKPIGSRGCSSRYPSKSCQILEKPGGRVLRHHQRGRSWWRACAFTQRMRCNWRRAVSRLGRRAAWSNDLSARARHDTLSIPRKRCAAPNGGSRRRSRGFASLRDREGIIDPRRLAVRHPGVAGSDTRRDRPRRYRIIHVKHYMRADAPSVRMLDARIQSLQGSAPFGGKRR